MTYGAIVDPRDGEFVRAVLLGRPADPAYAFDAERMERLIVGHGLAALLADAQRDHPSAALRPISERLRALAALQDAQVRSFLDAAADVGRTLDERGVRHVFVKGAALARTVYDRAAHRPFGDLDLLVEPRRVDDATAALLAAGYRYEPTRPNPMQVHYARGPVTVDLHWAFTSSDSLLAPVRFPVSAILDRARRAEGLSVPCIEDSMLLGAANLVRSCVPTFILVVDFDRMARRMGDWDAALERAVAWGLRTSLWLGLRLSADLCETPVPPAILDRRAPAAWRGRWLRDLLAPLRFWRLSRTRDLRYRFLLKLLCLDSPRHVLQAVGAAQMGALRKLGLIGATPRA